MQRAPGGGFQERDAAPEGLHSDLFRQASRFAEPETRTNTIIPVVISHLPRHWMRMRVSIDHHVDASDTDADGMHDWHYEYDLYRFSQGWRSFVARAYSDEPGKVAFLSREVKVFGFYRHRLLNSADLGSSLFVAAVAHLRDLGITSFDRLTEANGYVSIRDMGRGGAAE